MISSLNVTEHAERLNVSWIPHEGVYTGFIVELKECISNEITTLNVTETSQTFHKLKSGTEYKVTVFTINGELRSSGKEKSVFTRASLWS